MTDKPEYERPPRMTVAVLEEVIRGGNVSDEMIAKLQLADAIMQMTLDPTTYDEVPDAVNLLASSDPMTLGIVALHYLQCLKRFEGYLSDSMETVDHMSAEELDAVIQAVRRTL